MGGGYKTLLLVMAVLGLFSLVGCSNASGGGGSGNGSNSPNDFVGTWKYSSQELVFKADGTVSGDLLYTFAEQSSSTYTVSGNVATIKSGFTVTVTATLNQDGSLTFSGKNTKITLTKQTSSSTKK